MPTALNKIQNRATLTSIVNIRGIKIGLRLLSEKDYLLAAEECIAQVKSVLEESDATQPSRFTLDLMIRELMTQIIARAAFDPESNAPVFSASSQVRSEIIRDDRNRLIDSYAKLEEQFRSGQCL